MIESFDNWDSVTSYIKLSNIANMMGTLGKITDTIVPMSAICPTPMAKYNSWTAPTNTPATGA